MEVLKGLNDFERNNLLETHNRHLRAMGTEQRAKHKLENIIKIERNHREKCFNVYYDNGEWWHYTFNNEWY